MANTHHITCEGINWIDVCNPSRAEVVELSRVHNLNQHIVQDSLQPEHLPKYESVEDVNFMIIVIKTLIEKLWYDMRFAELVNLTAKPTRPNGRFLSRFGFSLALMLFPRPVG